MVKYWIEYLPSKDTAGYNSLEGFVTDIMNWMQEEDKDPKDKLFIYENHNKSEGFYILRKTK